MNDSSIPPGAEANLSRRGFLRCGLIGTALLGTGTLGLGLTGCGEAPKGHRTVQGTKVPYFFLTEDDERLLLALVPAILDGVLATEPDQRAATVLQTLGSIDEAIYRFSPAIQSEFRLLFDLLTFSPTRALTGGVWQSWDTVDTARADVFLRRWRDSSISLFTTAYNGLVNVTNVSYYGLPANWHNSHYPGPPAYAVNALPQFKTG